MTQREITPKQAFLDLLAEYMHAGSSKPDLDAVSRFREIAAEWSACGAHFSAGYVLREAIDYAWGDPATMMSCSAASLREFNAAAAAPGATLVEQAAALRMALAETGMSGRLFGQELGAAYRLLGDELAQVLLRLGNETRDPVGREGFLVRGFILHTDMEGSWSSEFPDLEIRGTSTGRTGDGQLTLTVHSAFRHFIDSGDYMAAADVARQVPGAFTAPGLRGWRAAVSGLLHPDEAVERFAEAAMEFAQDLPPSPKQRRPGVSWTSANKDLWASYFSARSVVAEIIRTPSRAAELLDRARALLEGSDSGWVHPQVTCFAVITAALSEILVDDPDVAASRAKADLLRRRRLQREDANDALIIDFLDLISATFSELRRRPAAVVLSTGVADALTALGRIPLVGAGVASAITPIMEERTFAGLFSQSQTWMYRAIESIADEKTLQKLILRLLQGRLPLYAQIRHGPLEYGKDIAVLAEDNGETVLQMYQVKTGDITMPVWRTARYELEEIFQVELPAVQLPVIPSRREGILIFNGHLNQNVEPAVSGWLAEQRIDHNRSFTIMHLDHIVRWIARKGLVNELRVALDELGIRIE